MTPDPGQRTARPRRHRQRRRARPDRHALFLDGKDEETIDRLARPAPLERLGTPEDIAEAVAFLAGPARWINGQVICANGGII